MHAVIKTDRKQLHARRYQSGGGARPLFVIDLCQQQPTKQLNKRPPNRVNHRPLCFPAALAAPCLLRSPLLLSVQGCAADGKLDGCGIYTPAPHHPSSP